MIEHLLVHLMYFFTGFAERQLRQSGVTVAMVACCPAVDVKEFAYLSPGEVSFLNHAAAVDSNTYRYPSVCE